VFFVLKGPGPNDVALESTRLLIELSIRIISFTMSSEASPSRRVFTVRFFCLYKLILINARRHTLAPQAPHPEATAQGIYPLLNYHSRPLILVTA
jgi:hypothetical protein